MLGPHGMRGTGAIRLITQRPPITDTKVPAPTVCHRAQPARLAFNMIIVSEPSAKATRPVRTGRYTPARSRSSAAHNGTPRYADARPISVHTNLLDAVGDRGLQHGGEGERSKIRPCTGRRTSSRIRTRWDTTRTNQQVTADRPPDHRRPVRQATKSWCSRCRASSSARTEDPLRDHDARSGVVG
jgi:hypothetical protein